MRAGAMATRSSAATGSGRRRLQRRHQPGVDLAGLRAGRPCPGTAVIASIVLLAEQAVRRARIVAVLGEQLLHQRHELVLVASIDARSSSRRPTSRPPASAPRSPRRRAAAAGTSRPPPPPCARSPCRKRLADDVAPLGGFLVAGARRDGEPLVGLDQVLRHAEAAGMQDRQVELAVAHAALGRLAEERRRPARGRARRRRPRHRARRDCASP